MYSVIKDIKTREDFLGFLEMLADDRKCNVEDWENKSVEEYIRSIQSWIEDMDGYYQNTNQEMPRNINWNFIANLFYVGKIYE